MAFVPKYTNQTTTYLCLCAPAHNNASYTRLTSGLQLQPFVMADEPVHYCDLAPFAREELCFGKASLRSSLL